MCGEASCAQRNILRVGEHFVHRVTDCAEGNQSRLFSAQNVPLCTKFSVTCDRPWPAGGDGAGRGAGWVLRGCLGYLSRTRRHEGRHGLRRLRAQAIRAAHAGTGDGVTGAGGVVGGDRRIRRQKAGDGQAHLLLGAPEESRTRRQNGGRDLLLVCVTAGGVRSQTPTPGRCAYSTMFSFLWFSQALAPGGRTTVPVLSGAR